MQDPNIRIDEILDAAEPLFFTKGYKKTTITDITSKMGVAKGMIYYYFRSKEEILEAIINRQTQVLLIHIKEIVSSQEKNPVQKFECIVASMFRTIQYRDGVLLNIGIVE
jgi:AcrR family transcriptional regulator